MTDQANSDVSFNFNEMKRAATTGRKASAERHRLKLKGDMATVRGRRPPPPTTPITMPKVCNCGSPEIFRISRIGARVWCEKCWTSPEVQL